MHVTLTCNRHMLASRSKTTNKTPRAPNLGESQPRRAAAPHCFKDPWEDPQGGAVPPVPAVQPQNSAILAGSAARLAIPDSYATECFSFMLIAHKMNLRPLCAQTLIGFARSTRSTRAAAEIRAPRWNGSRQASRSSRSSSTADRRPIKTRLASACGSKPGAHERQGWPSLALRSARQRPYRRKEARTPSPCPAGRASPPTGFLSPLWPLPLDR